MKNTDHSRKLAGTSATTITEVLTSVGFNVQPETTLSIEAHPEGWLIKGVPAPTADGQSSTGIAATVPVDITYKPDIGALGITQGSRKSSATIPVFDGKFRGLVPPRGQASSNAMLTVGGWKEPDEVGITSFTSTWTRSTGLNYTVNDVTSGIPIGRGNVSQVIGYDANGIVVYEDSKPTANTVSAKEAGIREKEAVVISAESKVELNLRKGTDGRLEVVTMLLLAGAGSTIRLPAIPDSIASEIVPLEFTVKCLGDWSGTYRIEAADRKPIDGYPYREYKKNARRQPAKLFRYTGKAWILTSDSA